MISDNEPLVNTYISVPKEMSQLNCAAYVAGVMEGVCDGCGMRAGVSAHNGGGGEMWPGKTVFLIKFEEGVVEREGFVGGVGRWSVGAMDRRYIKGGSVVWALNGVFSRGLGA